MFAKNGAPIYLLNGAWEQRFESNYPARHRLSFFSSLGSNRYKNKGSVPFGVEPFTSDSVVVALHAYGGEYACTELPLRFLRQPALDFPVEVQSIGLDTC